MPELSTIIEVDRAGIPVRFKKNNSGTASEKADSLLDNNKFSYRIILAIVNDEIICP